MDCCVSSNKVEDANLTAAVDKIEITNWKKLLNTLQQNESLTRYALARKRNDFTSLSEVHAYLSAYKHQNQTEQAWLIYLWITDNIHYNASGYFSGNLGQNDPESVFNMGMSVCDGYASLFQRLCENIGIECQKIVGNAKAFGYTIGDKLKGSTHAWNAIRLGEKWHYVEATWGSGYLDPITKKYEKSFDPYWFLVPADIFIFDHYNESFQLQTKKITLKEFEEMPCLMLKFHLNGFKLISHNSSLIVAENNPLVLEFSGPANMQLTSYLKTENGNILENTIFIKNHYFNSLKCHVQIILPKKNTFYNCFLFTKQSSETIADCVAKFRVIRYSGEEESNSRFPTEYAQYTQKFGDHCSVVVRHPYICLFCFIFSSFFCFFVICMLLILLPKL